MSNFKPVVVLHQDSDGMGPGFVVVCNNDGWLEVIADKQRAEDNAGEDELADDIDYYANNTRLSANVQAVLTLSELIDAYNAVHGTNYPT